MKLKLTLLSIAFFLLTVAIQAQSCPANWGMSTMKMVKLNTIDLDKLCNEYPTEGAALKAAVTSSASSGSGNGYQWEKKNGKITIYWDKLKFSSSKLANAIRKFFSR